MNSGNEMGMLSVRRPEAYPSKKNIETSHCSGSNFNTRRENSQNESASGGEHPPPTTTNASPDNQPSAETRALRLLKASGFTLIQQLDWVAKNPEGQWVVIEVKCKELFEPGTNFPYYGTGLDRSQLFLRSQLRKDLGWRTYLLVFIKGTEDVYGAYLDELENGEFYDTPKNIKIYPIENFTKLEGESPLNKLREQKAE